VKTMLCRPQKMMSSLSQPITERHVAGNVEHTGPSCENTTTACNKQERKRQYKWKSAKLSKAETAVSFAGTPHPVHSVTGENLQHPVDFFSVLFH